MRETQKIALFVQHSRTVPFYHSSTAICSQGKKLHTQALCDTAFIYRPETNGHNTHNHFISAKRSVRSILLTARLSLCCINKETEEKLTQRDSEIQY